MLLVFLCTKFIGDYSYFEISFSGISEIRPYCKFCSQIYPNTYIYKLKRKASIKNIVNVKVKIDETFSIDKIRREIITDNVKTNVRECCEIKGLYLALNI